MKKIELFIKKIGVIFIMLTLFSFQDNKNNTTQQTHSSIQDDSVMVRDASAFSEEERLDREKNFSEKVYAYMYPHTSSSSMEHLKKIISINLLVLLLMTGGVFVYVKTQYQGGMMYLLMMAIVIFFQVLINATIGIVGYFQKAPHVKSFFIAMVVVLIIGFSFCIGGGKTWR